MGMKKAELKETLDKMGVDYEDDATNVELIELIEANNNPTPSEETSSIEDAPESGSHPEDTGSAELISQDASPDPVGSHPGTDGFVDPNWDNE